MWKNVGYGGITHMTTLKNRDLTQNDARGTLTWKNRAKISKKRVKKGTVGFSMKFAIIWWGDMFSSLKNTREKWARRKMSQKCWLRGQYARSGPLAGHDPLRNGHFWPHRSILQYEKRYIWVIKSPMTMSWLSATYYCCWRILSPANPSLAYSIAIVFRHRRNWNCSLSHALE